MHTRESRKKAMSHPVLAKSDVLERVDGDIEFLVELTEGFIGTFPTQLAELSAAIVNSDYIQTERKAHSLKGALKNLGGLKSGESAHKIEAAAKIGDLSNSKELLSELVANVKEFELEFRNFISTFK